MRSPLACAAALLLGCHSGAVTSNTPPRADGAPPSSRDGSGFTFQPGDGGEAEAGSGPLPDEKTCSEQVHAARPVPVDLLLLVDSSSSMLEPVAGRTKHALVRDALVSFVGDPRSAGLGIALQYFPLPRETECTSDADCGPFDSSAGKPEWYGCRTPMVCAPPRAPLGTAVNICAPATAPADCSGGTSRSEEHTSELQT